MFEIRPAIPADVPAIFSLIQALAEYEKLADQVTGSIDDLHSHLFGSKPLVHSIVAVIENKPIAFALFFYNYSTFLTKPGIYLEDLFVLPQYRGQGIGKALLTRLAEIAVEQDCGRLEWSVLDWNDMAIGFYKRMGATVLPDWRICRVTGVALTQMAAQQS
ncbi:GNAT family N-acetyltransferase [Leptolyngbya sp. NIES-2104]|uniref:GNAT family N-acetyltransferase n=1 Tax=Leptolyngbya sp. NIES-2104 TaxID=1552121 RepID=UPI0006EC9D7F|nr:GNAT family N-acetyltransferase [Leptolyngbya sp. NIES-2104]GAP96242.1 histone acetyltransferase HPA2 and related acetyltransferases [Leptolyngbya sp. NIES-2104]